MKKGWTDPHTVEEYDDSTKTISIGHSRARLVLIELGWDNDDDSATGYLEIKEWRGGWQHLFFSGWHDYDEVEPHFNQLLQSDPDQILDSINMVKMELIL